MVRIIGAGLSGVEAAYQLLKRGIEVELCEMRPKKMTPAHKTGAFAELVCSNSFKSMELKNASGLLKKEMEILDSVILEAAYHTSVPAGKALAVDRKRFTEYIMEKLQGFSNLVIKREEVEKLELSDITIVATGPLTSDKLWKFLNKKFGSDTLFFYDAISPIVTVDSIDFDRVFMASRYDKGSDYINCPMNKEEYDRFYNFLVNAELAPLHNFDKKYLFPRCQPIEEIAKTGYHSLRFGPLKPVGLRDPRTGEEPYAVVQLRYEDKERRFANLVGFQTRLKWGEQKKLLALIPGLENAEIVRYGEMHINKYIDSPRLLNIFMQTHEEPVLFFAGQITGVEGYLESAASGLYVGLNVARLVSGKKMISFPPEFSIMGALFSHITNPQSRRLEPTYANYALVFRTGKRQTREFWAKKNLEKFREWVERNGVL